MNIENYFAVTGIFSALFMILGAWLKSRLEGSIGHEYAKILELFKTKNQLRIAALSERLRAHQQAYQLWREINTHLGTDEIHEVILKCDSWWGENCLYLEPEARRAFLIAFVRARDIETYKNSSSSLNLISECHKEINDAGAIIESSVALPPLNEFEFKKSA